MAARLIRSQVQTIVFAPSRMRVELLLTYLREVLRNKPGDAERVAGYRGGYLPGERRRIEQGLRDGTVRGVVATNGPRAWQIDIGGLGASVVMGYPGSLASLWQQFGRAGLARPRPSLLPRRRRRPTRSTSTWRRTRSFSSRRRSRMLCSTPTTSTCWAATSSVPPSSCPSPRAKPSARTPTRCSTSWSKRILQRSGGRYYWMQESYPAEQVSLRTASTDNFVIIEQGPNPRVIGECDRPSAPVLIHEDAIYLHRGQQYQVEHLDWENKKAYVTPVSVDYYTDAQLAVELKVLEGFEFAGERAGQHELGEVAITQVATIFKKVKLNTHENVGWGKIAIPEESLPHLVPTGLAFD
ncbi:MAG: hypothetical protein U5Q44_04315 [Dehalococcoidia bacterium]|nr:hypothetical protein [Dehalococcoidia bacterium]